MSFQAYIDNIKEKTGKTPADFKKLAEKKGLLKPGIKAMQIINWLKEDFDLGRGHGMAIYAVLTGLNEVKNKPDEAINKHFSGAKSSWRKIFDSLLTKLRKLGDVTIAPTNTYLSLLKDGKKFAIVQVTTNRLDIGIKLKSEKPTERFQPAGSWNEMVTHRVQISDPNQIDKELIKWLQSAYNKA